MTAFDIRVADFDDAENLAAVGTRSFLAAYTGTASDADLNMHAANFFSEPAVSQELLKSGVAYLGAFTEQECLGFVKIRDGGVPEQLDVSATLEIQQFYVAPTAQRIGLGRQLMAAALQYASDAAVDGVWLSVWTEADWATSFYRREGFETIATIPFQLGTTTYDDYLMWRPFHF